MLLTLNATSWMAIIYAIKEGWTIGKIPSHLFGILLLIIPVFLSWLSLALSRFLGAESPVVNCKEFNLADGEFLPIYLGYFFVSVRFLYKGIIINHNKKLSQPTLKRRFFKKKAAFFSWPGLGKEWC